MVWQRVRTRFSLGGVWVDPDALGASCLCETEKEHLTVSFPRSEYDFREEGDDSKLLVQPAWTRTGAVAGGKEMAALHILCIDVRFEGTLTAADRERAIEARDAGEEVEFSGFSHAATALCGRGIARAGEIAHSWLAHVRGTTMQPWLGLAVRRPAQFGTAWLYDDEADVRLFGLGPEKSVQIRMPHAALSVIELQRICKDALTGAPVPVAESLVNDALYLARDADTLDAGRAVLAAAMACEIKAKQVMRTQCHEEAKEAVDQLLDRVSNLPQLLTGPLKASMGVSLKDEQPELYKRIAELSARRNQVVHEAAPVSHQQGFALSVAAKQLLEWLDGLGQSMAASPPE